MVLTRDERERMISPASETGCTSPGAGAPGQPRTIATASRTAAAATAGAHAGSGRTLTYVQTENGAQPVRFGKA
jgi:hypothetical protein